MIYDWWINYLNRKAQAHYFQGWDWAAGELLRGLPSCEVLHYVSMAREAGTYNQFDRGVEEACRKWYILVG